MKLAVAQHPPISLDKAKSIERPVELAGETASGGCGLIVFPEAWLPGCPTFVWRLPPGVGRAKTDALFPNADEWINPGDAVVYQPFGGVQAGPMHKEKGLLITDIDVDAARSSRRKFDVCGHYARPDVFKLTVNRQPQSPVVFE